MGKIYTINQKVSNTENLNMGYLISGSNKIYEDFVLALKKYMENGKQIKHSYPIGYTKNFYWMPKINIVT